MIGIMHSHGYTGSLPTLRILLAEDDDTLRLHLTRALENAGHEIIAVDRGTKAVPLIENEYFDLLVSDIVMPEMDGIELAQYCGQVSPQTRVIFITGFAAITLKACAQTHAEKVLSKPFHLRELVNQIEQMFQNTEVIPLFTDEDH